MSPALVQALQRLVVIFVVGGLSAVGLNLTILNGALGNTALLLIPVLTAVIAAALKGLFAMGRSWYHWAHEPCWAVRKPGVPNLFLGERDQSTIWRAPSPKMIMAGSTEAKFDHPAQKPVVLFE